MSLAYPFTTIKVLQERWLHTTQQHKPQVNLCFRPNLTFIRHELPAGSANHTDVRNEVHVGSLNSELAAGFFPAVRGPGRSTESQFRNYTQPAPNAGIGSGIISGPLMAHRQLKLTFLERAEREAGATQGRATGGNERTRWSSQVIEPAEVLAQQLVFHKRRIERIVEDASTRTLPRFGAPPEQPAPSSKTTLDEAFARGAKATSAEQVVPAGVQNTRNIDVDQLTDWVLRELDRRVVAVRERMGRI